MLTLKLRVVDSKLYSFFNLEIAKEIWPHPFYQNHPTPLKSNFAAMDSCKFNPYAH